MPPNSAYLGRNIQVHLKDGLFRCGLPAACSVGGQKLHCELWARFEPIRKIINADREGLVSRLGGFVSEIPIGSPQRPQVAVTLE
jgi:hypothetical protein